MRRRKVEYEYVEPRKVLYLFPISPNREVLGLFRGNAKAVGGLATEQDALDIQRIGYEAWANSGWVKKIAASRGLSPNRLTRQAFDPENNDKVARQLGRMRKMGSSLVYWTAKVWNRSSTKQGQDKWEPIGLAKAEIEQTGHIASRGLQKVMRRSSVYLEVDVMPDYQRSGIGSALAYHALGHFDPGLKASLYTDFYNEGGRQWAEAHGYDRQTEVSDSLELFGIAPVTYVRYEADSISKVRQSLVAKHPWLPLGSELDANSDF